MPLVLAGATSGSTTIQATDAVTQTITLPAQTGTVMVNGPAFSVYLSASQSISSGTWTKIQFNTKTFDTNSNFDNTTNYRFTPTVAGYYQVNGLAFINIGTSYITTFLYKNGSQFQYGINCSATGNGLTSNLNCILYLNGSTDYIELYAQQGSGSSQNLLSGATATSFSAALIRGA